MFVTIFTSGKILEETVIIKFPKFGVIVNKADAKLFVFVSYSGCQCSGKKYSQYLLAVYAVVQ